MGENYHGTDVALTCSNGKQVIHFDNFRIQTHQSEPTPAQGPSDEDLRKEEELKKLELKLFCINNPNDAECNTGYTPPPRPSFYILL